MKTPKPERGSIRIQDRDVSILRGLFESRLMKQRHVAEIYFAGRAEAAKKRMQKLMGARLVAYRQRDPRSLSALAITRLGGLALRAHGALDAYPRLSARRRLARSSVGEASVPHELEVMDVKAAFYRHARSRPDIDILEFTTWPELNQFASTGEIVKPDGFAALEERESRKIHELFIEVDRSTEALRRVIACARRYAAHRKHDQKDAPFRLLMVFKSAERRNNVAEALLKLSPPILTKVWLTTLAEAKKDPLGPVWICPVDYRDAVHGSPHDAAARPAHRGYRRSPARERLVEARVKKRKILP